MKIFILVLLVMYSSCGFSQNFPFNGRAQIGATYGPSFSVATYRERRQSFNHFYSNDSYQPINHTDYSDTEVLPGSAMNLFFALRNRNTLRYLFDLDLGSNKQTYTETPTSDEIQSYTIKDTTYKVFCSRKTFEFMVGIENILIETKKFSWHFEFGLGFYGVITSTKEFTAYPYESVAINNYKNSKAQKMSGGFIFNSGFNFQVHLNKRICLISKPQWIYLTEDNPHGYQYAQNQIRILFGLGINL